MTVVEGYRQRKADVQQEKQFALTSQAQEVALKQANATLAAEERFLEYSKPGKNGFTKGVGSGMAPGGTPGQPPDPEDMVESLAFYANAAGRAGQPERAAELAAKASTIASNTSLIRQRGLEDRIKKAELAKSLLQGVQEEGGSQEAWDQSIALFQMQTGEASPYAGMEYTPELFEQVQNNVLSALDKAKVETEQQRRRTSAQQEVLAKAKLPLIAAQTKERLAMAEKHAKEGDIKPDSVSHMEGLFKSAIASKYDIDKNGAELKNMVGGMAERARTLQQDTRGELTATQAMQRIFQEEEADGTFTGFEMTDPSETRELGTFENPTMITRPKSDSPKDMEKWAAGFQRNEVYTTPKGGTYFWNPSTKAFDPARRKAK